MSTQRLAREDAQPGVVGGLSCDWSFRGFVQAYDLMSDFIAAVLVWIEVSWRIL